MSNELFAEEHKLIFNIEAIHPQVIEYYEDCWKIIFYGNTTQSDRNMIEEFFFIEESIGLPRGTMHSSIKKYYLEQSIDQEINTLRYIVNEMRAVLGD